VQLVPPYSVYLPDYALPGNDKLRVILLNRDLTQESYQIKLFLSIKLNDRVIMQTSRLYNPAPIQISPGIPSVLSGSDIEPYLSSNNLDFIGYSKEQYEKTKALPEGSFQICVTAYDYARPTLQLSNQGCSYYYLSKNEPPMINMPACGSRLAMKDPQAAIFSWIPRNTASPNSAGNTEYYFELFEMRIPGRNPNDIALTTQPVFTTITDFTQLFYGPAEPILTEGMQYVWRVQARDKEGKDMFRNNGYSEVCTFTYGGADPNYQVGVVKDLRAEALGEKKARIFWTLLSSDFDQYKVYYKKTGPEFEWFTSETKEGELKLYDLQPQTEYEVRIQGKKNGFYGGYSDIVKFSTPSKRIFECGNENPPAAAPLDKPLAQAVKGMVVNASGLDMVLDQVQQLETPGWYKGTGYVTVPMFGFASIKSKFERLYIDINLNAPIGRIEMLSRGIEAMTNDQLKGQEVRKKKVKQEENRATYKDVVFYDKVWVYDFEIKEVTIKENGDVILTDTEGNIHTNTTIAEAKASNPDKAIIIEDKKGDQYVITKDNKVQKVEGGGLSAAPTGVASTVTPDGTDIVKKSLKELRKDYSDSKILTLKNDAFSYQVSLKSKVDKHNAPYRTSGGITENYSSLMYDLDESDIATNTSSDFDNSSLQYKDKESEYNRASIVKYVASGLDSKEDYKLIASELKISGVEVSEYVAAQKSKGISETEMITQVKQAIIDMIDAVITNNFQRR
jgi:hypothetical protein